MQSLPVASGPERELLLTALATQAFTYSWPTGFDADGVLTRDGRYRHLNIRDAAVVPIEALARWAAALADSVEGSTPERLRAAADAGVLSTDQSQTLSEAFVLALELRIVHQLEQISDGQPPDDMLDPAAMSPLTRGHLRDVFRAVSTVASELSPA
jgi:CBS domain-containing protein